jgi:hypothetical protein
MVVMRRILLMVLLLLTGSTAESRDLFGRLGLGYNAQFAQTGTAGGSPGISLKYGFNPHTALELIGGFYSGTGGNSVAALKVMQTMHSESYLNFYFLLGGGLVSTASTSGTEFLGGFGSEFFIPGIENLGISFEAGVDIENHTSTSGSFILKSFGASFLNAGMHFYF